MNPLREGLCRAGDSLAHRKHDCIDFVRRLAALLGELAHLIGHDGEAATMLPGARRLDRRVEREQVGLICDGLDRAREANHFCECELQPIDFALRAVDDELRAIEHLERLENAGARAQ